jgi:hypothetical protein
MIQSILFDDNLKAGIPLCYGNIASLKSYLYIFLGVFVFLGVTVL